MSRARTALVLLSGLAAGTAGAASPSPDPTTLAVPPDQLSKARELVRSLGSDQFADREQAERRLAELGRLARAALLEGASTDPSPEVRSRCHALLPRATTLEMRARVEVFLADADGRYEHDLPGWTAFRSLARNDWSVLGHPVWSDRSVDAPARVVFADLLASRPNRDLVMAAGGPPGELGSAAAARRQELYNQKFPRGGVAGRPAERRDPTTADIVTLLFAESLAPGAAGGPRQSTISSLVSASGLPAAVQNGGDKAKVYRAVAAAWLASRRDPMDMYYATTVATNLGMPDDACRLAARLLGTKGAQVFHRGNAAATLARLGNKSHLPALEGALADTAVLTTVNRTVVKDGKAEQVRYDIQVRDVALALSLHLTGQKPEDYGFTDLLRGGGAGAGTFSYTRYYLPEPDRKAALEKWAGWRAENP